jgi:hypothetical protein
VRGEQGNEEHDVLREALDGTPCSMVVVEGSADDDGAWYPNVCVMTFGAMWYCWLQQGLAEIRDRLATK